MEFSEKLTVLRKEHGLSQVALAEELDVSRQAVSRWETGASLPSTEKLVCLSRLYGIPVDELIGEGRLSGPEQADTAEGPPPRARRPQIVLALLAAAALLLVIGIFIGLRLGRQEQAEEIETVPIEELERGRLEDSLIDRFTLGL